MMRLEVYSAMGVVVRKQDAEPYAKLVEYLENSPFDRDFPSLSVHEAGSYVVGDEDERNALVIAIESTVKDFDFFTGNGENPVYGAFEFSSLQPETAEYRELVSFLQEFEIEKPIDMVVWNYVSS